MTKRKPRILLIDDNKRMVRLLTLVLEDAGFETIPAHSGPEGLRRAYEEHPDLALLDVLMDGMDGFQVLDQLHLQSSMPIIMLTAQATRDADEIRGLERGAVDYVTKPFSNEVLIARIRTALRFRPPDLPRGVRHIDKSLLIDVHARRVEYAQKPVNLTPLEWRLLERLLEREGQIVTKEELIRAGWGDLAFDESNGIKVQISHLRKKLHDSAHPSRYIHTVREEGYLFEPRS